MKHVAFKKVQLLSPTGTVGELDYKTYLEVAIKNPLDQKSLEIEEMHKSIRLLNAMEMANESGVDFEDGDFEFLCKKVKALRYSWVDPAFAQFVEDVTKG